jgi:hypothetical protein
MQAIFDQADSRPVAAGLLADAVLSLLRQWSLRPQFWEESPLVAAGEGTPLFRVLDGNKPRTAALVYGALMSVLVLNGVSWTMGYAWNHPIFIQLRRPVLVPPASWGTKSTSAIRPEATRAAESDLYTDEGRVVLIFPSRARPSSEAGPTIFLSITSPPAEPSRSSGDAAPIFLQAYPGTYLSTSESGERVNVTLNSGRLQLEVVGVFSSPIVPVPGSQQMNCAVRNCSATFSTNASGVASQVEIHFDGRTIQASRVQGAVF